MSDHALLARARHADHSSLEELHRRHIARARTVAALRGATDSGRVAQLAMTRLVEAHCIATGALRTHLYQIVRDLTHDEVSPHHLGPADAPHNVALRTSSSARAFDALPQVHQEVLWYVDVEEVGSRRTAIFLGCPVQEVEPLAWTARAKLAELWQPQCPGCRARMPRDTAAKDTAGAVSEPSSDAHSTGTSCPECRFLAQMRPILPGQLALVLLPLATGVHLRCALSLTGTPQPT